MQEDLPIDVLIAQLRSRWMFEAISLIKERINIEKPIVPQLLALLKLQDASSRAVIQIPGHLRVKDALPLIEPFLLSENMSLQETAVVALGDIKPDNLLEILLSVLRSDLHRDLRTTAAWTLREIDSPQVIPILIETLSDENLHVREAASEALIVLGNASLPAPVKAFVASDERVRHEAHITLSLIVEEFSYHRSPDIKFDRELLVDLIQPLNASVDTEVREFAVWALQELKV